MNRNQKIGNLGAEKNVMLAILNNRDVKAEYGIKEEDFTSDTYKKILNILTKYHGNIDLTDGEIENLTGTVYDTRQQLKLDNATYVIGDYQEYIDELKKLSKRREQLLITEQLSNKIRDGANEEEILSIANKFYETEKVIEQDTDSIRDEILGDAFHTGGDIKRFLVCYKDLDAKVGGFYPSQIITVAARPSIGKTALALNFIANQIQAGHKIVFFSLEMSKKEVYQRLYSRFGRVEMGKIKGYINMNDEEKEKLVKGVEKLESIKDNLTIYDDKFGISEIVNQIRLLHNKGKVDLVYIDYVGLIESKGENRNIQISNITRELKKMAQKLKIAIVILAQLNRGVENRMGGGDEPQLSDLRDSGAIEQDSNVVIMLQNEDDVALKLLIRKNRDGEIGRVFVKKELRYMTIREFKPEELLVYENR